MSLKSAESDTDIHRYSLILVDVVVVVVVNKPDEPHFCSLQPFHSPSRKYQSLSSSIPSSLYLTGDR